ncbi:MAG: hypothetical protein ACM3PW_04325 [Chlamydiota bacterium]
MRIAFATCVLGLSLVLLGCGNGYNSSPANLSGNWTANLQQTSGAAAFSFSTTLTEVGGSILNGSNLTFNPATNCFNSQTTESGAVQFSGGGYGYYSGGGGTTAMSLTIKGLSAAGATDTLNLQGTVNPDKSVSGTWTLNGVSATCSGSGGFTMTRH